MLRVLVVCLVGVWLVEGRARPPASAEPSPRPPPASTSERPETRVLRVRPYRGKGGNKKLLEVLPATSGEETVTYVLSPTNNTHPDNADLSRATDIDGGEVLIQLDDGSEEIKGSESDVPEPQQAQRDSEVELTEKVDDVHISNELSEKDSDDIDITKRNRINNEEINMDHNANYNAGDENASEHDTNGKSNDEMNSSSSPSQAGSSSESDTREALDAPHYSSESVQTSQHSPTTEAQDKGTECHKHEKKYKSYKLSFSFNR